MAPVFDDELDLEDGEEGWCQLSFRKSITVSIALCVLAACASMYSSLSSSASQIQVEGQDWCEAGASLQQGLVNQLIDDNITSASFSGLLGSIRVMIDDFVQTPADSAVDALWGSMLARHRSRPGYSCVEKSERDYLVYRSWVQLGKQWNVAGSPGAVPVGSFERRRAAEALTAGFDAGESFGFLLDQRTIDCTTTARSFYCGNCQGICDVFFAAAYDSPPGIESTRQWYLMNATNGEELLPISLGPNDERIQQSSDVQAKYLAHARRSPRGPGAFPATRLWSKMHQIKDRQSDLLLTRTAPISYCGDYACYEGSIGSDVNLRHLSKDCYDEWAKLAELLASPAYKALIGPGNSSVFIVHHVAEFYPDQQGLLVSASDPNMTENTAKIHAEDSNWEVVRDTSLSLLRRFGSWNATALRESQQFFAFDPSGASPGLCAEGADGGEASEVQREDEEENESNESNESNGSSSASRRAGCLQVGTMSVELDDFSRWLVVAVLPAGAFDRQERENEERVAFQVEEQERLAEAAIVQARISALVVFVIFAVASSGMGLAVGCCVSQPLHRLSEVMQIIGHLDFARESAGLNELRSGHRARLQDIRELQNAFYRLIVGIEAFTRFVPETVVTRIVNGNRRATRLYVDDCEVTAMFVCISDFDKISESLSKEQLLRILRLYHPAMTAAAERYSGAVAEILDDGLLVYWNAPDPVAQHWLQASLAALSQEKAMEKLNLQLASEGLPTLSIQIGLHTGSVLAGNIGSDMKMKFGCIGDSVNLASRLNGLCKHFGVKILCSGATQARIAPAGICCRELSTVKVKGKHQPTPIFEVLGQDMRMLRGGPGHRGSRASFGTEASKMSHNSTATGTSRSANLMFRLVTLGSLRALPASSSLLVPPAAPPQPSSAAAASATGLRTPDGPSPSNMGQEVSGGGASPATAASARSGRRAALAEEAAAIAAAEEERSQLQQEAPDSDDEGKSACSPLRRRAKRLPSAAVPRRSPHPQPAPTTPQRQATARGVAAQALQNLRASSVSPATAGTARSGGRQGGDLHNLFGSVSPTEAAILAAEFLLFEVEPEVRDFARRYEEALHAYQAARFLEARDATKALLAERPDDVATKHLKEMAEVHVGPGGEIVGLTQEELEQWTGVEYMTKK